MLLDVEVFERGTILYCILAVVLQTGIFIYGIIVASDDVTIIDHKYFGFFFRTFPLVVW